LNINRTKILGIDPGLSTTGYGVIESDGYAHQHIDHGHIKPKGETLAEKLFYIFEHVSAIVEPGMHMAVENVFVAKNAASALKLGHARAAAIIAAKTRDKVDVFEYAPREIKQATVGYGAADKEQVRKMVCQILKLKEILNIDSSDALATAICHAHTNLTKGSLQIQKARRK
jgi:crossover junction endodeoxyribonuclease RuvC